VLIVARFLQAVGGAGVLVLPRAVARDLYEGVYVARELSRMAAVMALTPVIAPLIGGVLQTAFGWRSNFVALTAFGLALAVMVWTLLPESLRTRAPEPVSLISILRSYGSFIRNGYFLAHLGIGVCAFVGLFVWISASSFVMQELYQLTPFGFGVAFAIGACGYLVGTSLASYLVTRIGVDRTIGFGALALAAGGLGMSLALAFGLNNAVSVVLAAALYLCGLGLVFPLTQAGALMPFPQRAGAASSLLGFVQQTSGAIGGATVGHLLGETAWPMAAGIALSGCAALLLWTLTRQVRQHP